MKRGEGATFIVSLVHTSFVRLHRRRKTKSVIFLILAALERELRILKRLGRGLSRAAESCQTVSKQKQAMTRVVFCAAVLNGLSATFVRLYEQ